MKLIISILAFMILAQWVYYCELDKRVMADERLARLIFSAQNEAFAVHAHQINQLTDIMGEIVEMKS